MKGLAASTPSVWRAACSSGSSPTSKRMALPFTTRCERLPRMRSFISSLKPSITAITEINEKTPRATATVAAHGAQRRFK